MASLDTLADVGFELTADQLDGAVGGHPVAVGAVLICLGMTVYVYLKYQ